MMTRLATRHERAIGEGRVQTWLASFEEFARDPAQHGPCCAAISNFAAFNHVDDLRRGFAALKCVVDGPIFLGVLNPYYPRDVRSPRWWWRTVRTAATGFSDFGESGVPVPALPTRVHRTGGRAALPARGAGRVRRIPPIHVHQTRMSGGIRARLAAVRDEWPGLSLAPIELPDSARRRSRDADARRRQGHRRDRESRVRVDAPARVRDGAGRARARARGQFDAEVQRASHVTHTRIHGHAGRPRRDRAGTAVDPRRADVERDVSAAIGFVIRSTGSSGRLVRGGRDHHRPRTSSRASSRAASCSMPVHDPWHSYRCGMARTPTSFRWI